MTGAIKEQYLKAANVKKRQCCSLDIKHALEQWPCCFGTWRLVYSFCLLFLYFHSFWLSLNRALYNGAPKTIRQEHYFSSETAHKNNNNFDGGVAALLCVIYAMVFGWLAGWIVFFLSVSFCTPFYRILAICTIRYNNNNNARIFLLTNLFVHIFFVVSVSLVRCFLFCFVFSNSMFTYDSPI